MRTLTVAEYYTKYQRDGRAITAGSFTNQYGGVRGCHPIIRWIAKVDHQYALCSDRGMRWIDEYKKLTIR